MPDPPSITVPIVPVVSDVAYVVPKVMFEAVCTCGWKQPHELIENAKFDAERHQREWHGTEARLDGWGELVDGTSVHKDSYRRGVQAGQRGISDGAR